MAQESSNHRIEAFTTTLMKRRDAAVQFRASSGVERRWREDEDLFEGLDIGQRNRASMLEYATGEAWMGKGKEPKGSKVVVNIVRGKCNTAEGRFSEICLPTDDMNWGIKPSPVPQLAEEPKVQQAVGQAVASIGRPPGDEAAAMQPQGQPMQPLQPGGEAPSDAEEVAKKKAKAMQDEIDDQLEECDFNNECRKVVRSAVRLGTGVIKGPCVVKTVRKVYEPLNDSGQTVYVLKRTEKHSPASKNVSIWNIYPDPDCGEDPKKGAYLWERDDHLLPRDLAALIGLPGYNERQIRLILAEEPKRTTVAMPEKGGGAMEVQHNTVEEGSPYERWEYHGDISKQDLEAMGCKCPDGYETFSACAVFVNDRPIKMVLNVLDTGEIPYDFFQWEQVAGSCWGIGEPRKIMWQQRIINGAWRAMMNNAGDSSRSKIVIADGVNPDDDIYTQTGLEVYRDEREIPDVRSAFGHFQSTNNQKELESVIEMALKFTDLESGTPALAQGEKGSSPETLGGMQLLMQGADTNRRRQVKQWDDQITKPHIQRYYHWNMQYNDENDIKGDYEVDARGTSVLLVKDQAAVALKEVFGLRADPEFRVKINWDKALNQLLESRHLDILNTQEEEQKAREAEGQKGQQVAPAVQAAQIRAASAEKIKGAELQSETSENQKDRENAVLIKMIDARLASEDLAAAERQFLENIKAEIGIKAIELRTQVALSDKSISHDKDLAMGEHIMDLHSAATPPTEPAGRAPAGQAYAA